MRSHRSRHMKEKRNIACNVKHDYSISWGEIGKETVSKCGLLENKNEKGLKITFSGEVVQPLKICIRDQLGKVWQLKGINKKSD